MNLCQVIGVQGNKGNYVVSLDIKNTFITQNRRHSYSKKVPQSNDIF